VPLQSLSQILILLLASVLVVALTRRLGLPAILGYLIVGIAVGPHALAVVSNGSETQAIAEIGVVFVLFTLGLEFSFPRMLAMKREVMGLGLAQTLIVGGTGALITHFIDVRWPSAIVAGGALAMCSTAIVLQQLSDQDELHRSHGRLSFAVLLFQDLAFVPLLTLATVQANAVAGSGTAFVLRLVGLGMIGLAAVLALGRWLVRPLLYEIAHSRLRELFTLAALLIVLTSAWITQRMGLSMALGAFLAGMLLAETEYRHQIDATIRPFRELLLGLFFISVGMLLDLKVLGADFVTIVGLLLALLLGKTLLTALTTLAFGVDRFKSLRTGLVLAGGGEFGVALLTILARGEGLVPARPTQLLLSVLVLSMIVCPVIIRYNKRIARFILREQGPRVTAMEREEAATKALAQREHVILCGFGRVGGHLARVLDTQGFEYLAVDRDPAKVRAARQGGLPVVWGDCSNEELLNNVGLDRANVVIVTFADPLIALEIVRTVRRLRAEVPVLVRTQDESRLAELSEAGATEVVPETLEASLTLVSQALTLLNVPATQVTHRIDEMRRRRYATLRTPGWSEELRSIVLPPGGWAVGRRLNEVRARGAEVAFTAVRRAGITGHEPDGSTELREGDVVMIFGSPEALEHAEAVLLAG
jgi:CPA2 family monovalent cation:H+ antiporter-2